MRGLTIVLAGPDPDRARTALAMAAAQAALGGAARLFLDAAAVPLLGPDRSDVAPPGLPTRAELIDTCLALGVTLLFCQTGLADAGLSAAALDPRAAAGGMPGVIATLGDDRLVTI